MIVVRVDGTPRPQGSKTAGVNQGTGRVFMREASPGLKVWRDLVRVEAQVAALRVCWRPVSGPVCCEYGFVFGLPKRPGGRRADDPHCQDPDIDKLVRAVNDAVSGVLFVDDNQVCGVVAWKRWGVSPGLVLTVAPLDTT